MSIDGSAQHENNIEKLDDRLTSRSHQSARAVVEPNEDDSVGLV
jgi:hypothetical protein